MKNPSRRFKITVRRPDTPPPADDRTSDSEAEEVEAPVEFAADMDDLMTVELGDDLDGAEADVPGLKVPVEQVNGEVLIRCPGVLDIDSAADLRSAFLDALGKEGRVLVDMSAVERVSTSCIQVLIAAEEAISAASREAALKAPQEAVVQAFDDLGLFASLLKWKVET
ncbi:MAG: STAS domain-containing protein [Magnetovibrionaceae bacterium]